MFRVDIVLDLGHCNVGSVSSCFILKMNLLIVVNFCFQAKVKNLVVVGDPKEKICEVVDDLHADLLVMGNRAFGPIKR